MATTNSQTNSGIVDIAITDVNGNVIGIDAQQVNVPSPANLIIFGGGNGDVLSTDGAGNLYWAVPGSGNIISPGLIAGNSNVTVNQNANITFSSDGVANVMVVSSNGIRMNRNTVLPPIGNVKISGGFQGGVLFSDIAGKLRWGGNFLLPEAGSSRGWLLANGLRLYRSGDGTGSYVASWRSNASTWRPISVPVLHDDMPTITSWQKIHMNEVSMYALGDNGVLYSQGIDTNGQQGNTTTVVTNEVLTPITHPTIYGPGITVLNFWSYDKAYAPDTASGAVCVNVDDNGTKRTYMFGYNLSGEQGNGTLTTANQVPTQITQLNGKTIVSVSFYVGMIMVVTSDGEVWGSGNNTNGQLGLGNTTGVTVFTRATKNDGSFLTNASSVMINWNLSTQVSTFIICNDGTLWAAGYNGGNTFVLGLGQQSRSAANVTRFTQLSLSGTVIKVDGTGGSTVALDSAGNLWSWSINREGFWGSGGENEVSGDPKIIQRNVADSWMVNVPTPSTRTIISLVWRDTNNITWGAGTNWYYYMGVVSSSANVLVPSSVPFRTDDEYPVRVKTIGLDDGTTFNVAVMWLTNKNRVYVTGPNDFAASILADSNVFRTPMEITNIL